MTQAQWVQELARATVAVGELTDRGYEVERVELSERALAPRIAVRPGPGCRPLTGTVTFERTAAGATTRAVETTVAGCRVQWRAN